MRRSNPFFLTDIAMPRDGLLRFARNDGFGFRNSTAPPRLPRVAVVKQDMPLPNAPIDIIALAKDLRAGHRAALARAITLIESRRSDHQGAARDLVQALLPDTGRAVRVGITGFPGVGKAHPIRGRRR